MAAALWMAFAPSESSTEKKIALVGSDLLVEVATGERQWTGVAVSAEGRVFVNFPRWQTKVPVSVGELDEEGNIAPYPNEEIKGWSEGDDPTKKFVCVQSVYVDRLDSFALGPDGTIWFTTSQIHLGPNPKTPYRVLKISPR
jgi:hypothetical protein